MMFEMPEQPGHAFTYRRSAYCRSIYFSIYAPPESQLGPSTTTGV
jgi:hypothetical protein